MSLALRSSAVTRAPLGRCALALAVTHVETKKKMKKLYSTRLVSLRLIVDCGLLMSYCMSWPSWVLYLARAHARAPLRPPTRGNAWRKGGRRAWGRGRARPPLPPAPPHAGRPPPHEALETARRRRRCRRCERRRCLVAACPGCCLEGGTGESTPGEGAGGALVTAGHGVGGLAAGGGDARPPLSLSEPTRAGAGAGARAGEPWGPPCAAGSQEAVKDGCGV